MPGANTLPLRRQGAWVRDKPKAKTPEAESSVKKIQVLVDNSDSYRHELKKRGDQMAELCEIASTLLALQFRIERGSVSELDLKEISIPPIHYYRSSGCDDGADYLKEAMTTSKSLIISLFRKTLDLERRANEVEEATNRIPNWGGDDEQAPASTRINPQNMLEFVREVGRE